MRKLELLAPAGSVEMLKGVIAAGADAAAALRRTSTSFLSQVSMRRSLILPQTMSKRR